MKEFMQKLNEIGFIEKMNRTAGIVPTPKNLSDEEIEQSRREAVWTCLNLELDNNEKLEEMFAELCLEAGKKAVLDEIKIDWNNEQAENTREALCKSLHKILDHIFEGGKE